MMNKKTLFTWNFIDFIVHSSLLHAEEWCDAKQNVTMNSILLLFPAIANNSSCFVQAWSYLSRSIDLIEISLSWTSLKIDRHFLLLCCVYGSQLSLMIKFILFKNFIYFILSP